MYSFTYKGRSSRFVLRFHLLEAMMKSLVGYKNAAGSEFHPGPTNPRPIVLSGFNYANEIAHRRLTGMDPLRSREFRVSDIQLRLRLAVFATTNCSLFITLVHGRLLNFLPSLRAKFISVASAKYTSYFENACDNIIVMKSCPLLTHAVLLCV